MCLVSIVDGQWMIVAIHLDVAWFFKEFDGFTASTTKQVRITQQGIIEPPVG